MNIIVALLLFAAALATEWRASTNFWAHYHDASSASMRAALLFHALSTGCILLAGNRWRRARGDSGVLWHFIGLTWGAFPCLGAALAPLSLVVLWNRDEHRSNLGTLLARAEAELTAQPGDLSAEIAAAEYALKAAKAASRDAAGARPYRELLLTASEDDKMEVIRRVRKLRTREAVEILHLARTDKSYGVRHLATTAVAMLEQEWQDSLVFMREAVNADPTSARPRNDLLMHYIFGCGSGLFLPKVARLHLKNALEEAEICVRIVPDSPDSLYKLGQVYGMAERFDQALAAFDSAIALKPDGANFRFWRAEVLFRLGRLAEVRDECKIIAALKPHPRIAKLVDYWAQRGEDFNAA